MFSRRLNSIVLIAASTMSGSKPPSASERRVVRISSSACGASSAVSPLRPALKVIWRNPPPKPPPITSSPSPLSTSALRKGEACVPIRQYESTLIAISSERSVISGSPQLSSSMAFLLWSLPASTPKVPVTRRGSTNGACRAILASTGCGW